MFIPAPGMEIYGAGIKASDASRLLCQAHDVREFSKVRSEWCANEAIKALENAAIILGYRLVKVNPNTAHAVAFEDAAARLREAANV
jgi:hypothetical protein